MPTFAFKARSSDGQAVTGTLVADTEMAATRILDERTLAPIELREVEATGASVLTGKARRVNKSAIGVTYEQLADLLRAGVPLLRGLNVLARQSSNASLARVLIEVHDDVAGGDTLADAMEKHPNAFPRLHVAMVRAGEKGGFMEDVLTRLSEFVARQDELRNKFLGSMIYPLVLMTVGVGAVTFIMSYVVPKVRPLIESQQLSLPTIVVFGVSDFLATQYLTLIGIVFITVVGLTIFFQSEPGRQTWSFLQLKTPGVGRIFTMVALCRFCRIFGTLLANGIPILQSLKVAKESAGNQLLADTIEEAAESVRQGESLTHPLGESNLFPPAMVDMLAVAEESNTLEKVLLEIANTQEQRTARQIDLFVRLLEPLMLMMLGFMVLFIAIALLVPILKMSTSGFK
ncbi:MAG: type II secretion system F family protein [Phycisphaerales bacterium]|nr:type II secretion system F family protein [Phycisphaerales bacterium]